MKTPESPSPTIAYHPIYELEEIRPYTVAIDGPSCGRLLTTLGMNEDRIRDLTIIVEPGTPMGIGDKSIGGSYYAQTHELVMYPTQF